MFRRDIEIKKIVIATGRTDMRKGIDGLVSLIRLKYFMDPLEVGTIFLLCGRRKNKMSCVRRRRIQPFGETSNRRIIQLA